MTSSRLEKWGFQFCRSVWVDELISIMQRFCNEVLTWKSLCHQNIVPLLGVMTTGNDQLAMVSEWMPNGNINKFVRTHKNVNRFQLVGPCSYCISHLSLMESFPIA